MKHRIAFNMWENKKDLIIQLYREEGWPLKHVIKRVRSHEFDPSENQLRSRLKKWCITKSSRHQKWPKSSINQNEADPQSNYSFVQTALNDVLNTATTVSAEQAGVISTAPLPNDHRVSQTPSLPSSSTLDGNDSAPPTYSSNTLYSTIKDVAPAMQQVKAGPGPLQGQLAPMWWIAEDGTLFLSTPYYVSAPVNPCVQQPKHDIS